MKYQIAWISGDGIGPEITQAALKVVEAVEKNYSVGFDLHFLPAGDEYAASGGVALPEETISGVRKADATIKGPVGETAAEVIVRLRQMFDLYANIRPAKSYPGLPAIGNVDLVIARENTEDLYKGVEFEMDGGAVAIRVITEKASRRIARVAAGLALARRRKVTIVHKANVLKKTCGLFARTALDELKRFPEIEVDQMYVDAASMALVKKPESFDVIVTTNMFGDILSDLAAQVAGGLGMAASANVGESVALFEPIHGSAPDITGLDIANPYSMILSVSMMLDWLGQKNRDRKLLESAQGIEFAVRKALETGWRTPDIGGNLGTEEVGRRVASLIVGRA